MGIEICFAKASKVVGERGRKMVDQWVNIIADDLGPALFLRLHIYPGRTARQLVSQASLKEPHWPAWLSLRGFQMGRCLCSEI